MKKTKIMFIAISILASLAATLAFKAKKANGFCLYRTTMSTCGPDEDVVFTCKTLGRFTITQFPNGMILDNVFTTFTHCADVPACIPTINCTRSFRVNIE